MGFIEIMKTFSLQIQIQNRLHQNYEDLFYSNIYQNVLHQLLALAKSGSLAR
ncbi:hypothetical protein J2S19_003352 [Metabacillus malikii]|uniref:Uncharacterized protein n=1 Tax=Metabacillus malikii TaxID=1504265 RepID=A0ABT9ZIH6_9BACI|nr:hypothetical protein [Metabacillus malikii]